MFLRIPSELAQPAFSSYCTQLQSQQHLDGGLQLPVWLSLQINDGLDYGPLRVNVSIQFFPITQAFEFNVTDLQDIFGKKGLGNIKAVYWDLTLPEVFCRLRCPSVDAVRIQTAVQKQENDTAGFDMLQLPFYDFRGSYSYTHYQAAMCDSPTKNAVCWAPSLSHLALHPQLFMQYLHHQKPAFARSGGKCQDWVIQVPPGVASRVWSISQEREEGHSLIQNVRYPVHIEIQLEDSKDERGKPAFCEPVLGFLKASQYERRDAYTVYGITGVLGTISSFNVSKPSREFPFTWFNCVKTILMSSTSSGGYRCASGV